jgi:hypothetical protein
MAIVTGVGDYLQRSADLPDPEAFTMCAWLYRTGAIGGWDSSVPLIISDGDVLYMTIALDGSDVLIDSSDDNDDIISDPGTDTWFFAAFTAGSGNGNLKGYAALPSDALSTASINPVDFAEDLISLNHSLEGLAFIGRIAAVKVWDAILTQDELENERAQYVPNRTEDLHIWSPFINTGGTSFLDISGNGRNWTESGAVTDADGPPIPWKRRRRFFVPVAVVVGTALPMAMNLYRRRRV